MIRNAGAHCPTNKAHSSFANIFKTAEAAIEVIAAAKYPEEGILEV